MPMSDDQAHTIIYQHEGEEDILAIELVHTCACSWDFIPILFMYTNFLKCIPTRV